MKMKMKKTIFEKFIIILVMSLSLSLSLHAKEGYIESKTSKETLKDFCENIPYYLYAYMAQSKSYDKFIKIRIVNQNEFIIDELGISVVSRYDKDHAVCKINAKEINVDLSVIGGGELSYKINYTEMIPLKIVNIINSKVDFTVTKIDLEALRRYSEGDGRIGIVKYLTDNNHGAWRFLTYLMISMTVFLMLVYPLFAIIRKNEK